MIPKMLLPGRQDLFASICVPSQTEFDWRQPDLGDEAMVGQARAAAEYICDHDPRAALDHDFDWVIDEAARNSAKPCIWFCHSGNRVVGYAPMQARPAGLGLCLGEMTLASLPVERYTLVGCPLFAPEVRDHEDRLTADFLAAVRRTLPQRGTVLVLGARADSALFSALTERDTLENFFVQKHGPLYNRRLVHLPESSAAYFASLGRNTRRDLRKHERRLLDAASEGIRLRRFTTPADVEPFLDAAIPVSRKTYQWKSLSLGLHDRQRLSQELCAAARRGFMLCYVLFDGATPVAFQLGYRYRGTYYAHHTGYDPDRARYSVGNLLLWRIVQDLIECHPELHCLDLLYGDSVNKERFSNASREEGIFYMFPRTLSGTAAFGSLTAFNALSTGVGNLLLRFGLKENLRRLLRR